MAESPIGGSPLDGGASPEAGRAVANLKVNSRTAVDSSAFKELNSEFKKLNQYVTKFQSDLPKLIEGTKKWAAELNKVAKGMKGAASGGGGGGSYLPSAGTTVGSNNQYNITKTVNYFEASGAGGGGGGGGTPVAGGGKGAFLQAAGSVVGDILGALDARAARGASYSLQADRMNMLYQQMTGLSQNQVYHQYRKPLQGYMLGMGGINQLLSLQASTGLNAQRQAGSVEAMRAASGFQYSTSDITSMTRALAGPESTNRMFMMLGTGMYGIGGKQRTQQQVYQDIIRRTGLTNEKVLSGAYQQGSMTRARLEMAGVPADQIDLILQYAQQNVAYQKKGGKGFYDPSNKAQRDFMGVGKNQYATQFEETERVRVQREENFYKRQNDNFAAMERNTQAIEKLTQKMEEMLSGLIGAGIATKPQRSLFGSVMKWGKKAVGVGLMAAGAIGAAPTAGGSLALSAAGAALLTGDPVGADGKQSGPTNDKTGGGPEPDNIRRSKGALDQLNARFAGRLKDMMRANPKITIGNGLRTSAQQKAMFLDRYKPTSEKTDMFWNGTYWKHVKGPAAAPPGMSMHQIGLAADLEPASEYEWIKQNASRFGLRSFFDVNNEPWHVQPSELPAGRAEYEKQGSPWGTKGDKFDGSAIIGGVPAASYIPKDGAGYADSGAKGFSWSGMSMGEIIGANAGASGVMSENASVSAMGTGGSSGSSSTSMGSGGGGALSGAEVARHLYNAGFRGNRLKRAIAIAWHESRFNARSHNTRGQDNSYGLMQINMKDDDPSAPNMGKIKAKRFKIAKYEDLFDPATNARVAWEFFSGETSGAGKMVGAGWKQWSGNAKVTDKDIRRAESYIKTANIPTGDPITFNSSGPAMSTSAGASYNINVSPSITINAGSSGNVDVQKLARDVATMMEREVRMTMMRTT